MNTRAGAMPEERTCALFADQYELTMLQAYWREGMDRQAVFSLAVRRLPARRNYLLACGLDTVLGYLEQLRFGEEDLSWLATLGLFENDFLDWLRDFRFTGDVYAMPEGTPVFGNEPILEVVAPLPQAQYIETYVMNQVHLQTLLASKAARVVHAAGGKRVVDFGARRIHGVDAATKGARAFYIAGVAATSNVLAGRRYGLPLAGTMAHSYVQAHDNEAAAFEAFARCYPETVLLVDTYDTLEAVRRVVRMAQSQGDRFRVQGLRLDSGDLDALSRGARQILDAAGLQRVKLIASGGLDEDSVAALTSAGAPIDIYGVGTNMGVSRDAPDLDIAYKLCEYGGRGRVKLSTGKPILPGRKQVFRAADMGHDVHDLIGRADEVLPGRPLLVPVMRAGERLPAGRRTLDEIRDETHRQIARLPRHVQALAPADPPYPVRISDALLRYQQQVARNLPA
jgi:nicotinate phosphoribosyltransferase